MTSASSVLDMGTGGGERFGELLTGFGGRAVATEEWHVNAPIAAAYLRPLGCHLVRGQSVVLPFRDGSFDLVLNRHEDLDPDQVARVLKRGGIVLTQQAFMLWKEMNRFFLGESFSRISSNATVMGFKLPASSFGTPARTKSSPPTRVSATSFTCSASRPGKSQTSTL
jgi:Methyltransferase domain